MTQGAMASALGVIGAPLAGAGMAHAAAVEGGGELTEHTLPELGYAYDALEPYIDALTMETHHSKHHAGYVRGLNAAEKAMAEARANGDYGMTQYWARKCAFNGGGHFLHSMFWKVMAPADNGGGGEPEGELAEHIARDFGSFDKFKAQFAAASGSVEGSGWGLLHYRPMDGRLVILQGENQQKLTQWGIMPILGIDVWEHAYYLKYQNRRSEYIENWWNVVNWGQVAMNLAALKKL